MYVFTKEGFEELEELVKKKLKETAQLKVKYVPDKMVGITKVCRDFKKDR